MNEWARPQEEAGMRKKNVWMGAVSLRDEVREALAWPAGLEGGRDEVK